MPHGSLFNIRYSHDFVTAAANGEPEAEWTPAGIVMGHRIRPVPSREPDQFVRGVAGWLARVGARVYTLADLSGAWQETDGSALPLTILEFNGYAWQWHLSSQPKLQLSGILNDRGQFLFGHVDHLVSAGKGLMVYQPDAVQILEWRERIEMPWTAYSFHPGAGKWKPNLPSCSGTILGRALNAFMQAPNSLAVQRESGRAVINLPEPAVWLGCTDTALLALTSRALYRINELLAPAVSTKSPSRRPLLILNFDFGSAELLPKDKAVLRDLAHNRNWTQATVHHHRSFRLSRQ
jgi:hypothetical protein